MTSYLSGLLTRDPTATFTYEVGERIPGLDAAQSIWTIHEGKLKKAPHTKVSVFNYDPKTGSDVTTEVAKNCLKRIKTLRHPNIVTYIDCLESEKAIYIVTEPVIPLSTYLEKLDDDKEIEMAISWGLHQVVAGLSFLVNNCNLIHNNVCMSSIYVDRAGEWKIMGLEYMFGENDSPPVKVSHGLEKYDPPEKSSRKKSCKWSSDMWGLGCLIWESFNGTMHTANSLRDVGKIPKNLLAHWAELVSANPQKRPNPEDFIASCRDRKQFMSNPFVDCNLFLGELQIKDADIRTAFLERLGKNLDHFPKDYARFKILPILLNAYQFGDAGAATLGPIFKLGQLLEEAEYQEKIVPCLVKMFSSSDRATRIALLRQIEHIVIHLKKDVINNQIFVPLSAGFHDSAPLIREATVKAILHIADKLDDKNLNTKLMSHFAQLQAKDDQGPIRTNTTICLGKILKYLNKETRQKVALSAFARALKDPFPPARSAGLKAMMENVEMYTPQEIAHHIVPAVSRSMCDAEKIVRDSGFEVLATFVKKLKIISDDPELSAQYLPKEARQAAPNKTGGVSSASSASSDGAAAASGWGSWAASAAMNMTMAAATAAASKLKKGPEAGPSAPEVPTEVVIQSSQSTPSQPSKSKQSSGGMKLQRNEPKEINWDAIVPEAKEASEEEGNGWGWGAEELDDEDADWGDDWNAPAKPIISVKKTTPKAKATSRKASGTGLNSGFDASNGDDWGNGGHDWNTDSWNSSSKSTTSAAARKKAEREEKLAARKAENERKRAMKKSGAMKLGTRKAD